MNVVERGQVEKLPKGWKWVKLGEICEINPTRPRGLSRDDDAPITFVPMPSVDARLGKITNPQIRPFSEVRKGYTYFEENDVLFAKISPCMENGKHSIASDLIDSFGFGTTEFHVLRAGSSVIPEWIYRFLRQPKISKEAVEHFSGSVGQQRVPAGYLSNLEILLPPLPEQKRIVDILTDRLSTIDKARAATEVQLKAAKALPAAYLRQVFDSPEARKWKRSKLGDIALISGGLQKTPNRSPSSFHRSYLTVRNVQRGWLDLSAVERFEITLGELERCRLKRGDLLIVEGNGSVDHIGRNAIYQGEPEDCIHQNHLIRVRLDQTRNDPNFLSFYLNSDFGKKQMLEKAMSTTGLHTLSVSKIQQMEAPIVSLEEQRRITSDIKEMLSTVTKLEQSLQSQLDTINKLPAALLRQAFNGEL